MVDCEKKIIWQFYWQPWENYSGNIKMSNFNQFHILTSYLTISMEKYSRSDWLMDIFHTFNIGRKILKINNCLVMQAVGMQ